jgi:hypothetical protein
MFNCAWSRSYALGTTKGLLLSQSRFQTHLYNTLSPGALVVKHLWAIALEGMDTAGPGWGLTGAAVVAPVLCAA